MLRDITIGQHFPGNSLVHRAFYALPPMTTADGKPTGALHGFFGMLLKLIADEPRHGYDLIRQIEDLTGLAGNLSVNFINADYNKIKSIAKLEECVMLVKMNLWDNPVNTDEVKKLQDVGIIINYNPEYKETDTEA